MSAARRAWMPMGAAIAWMVLAVAPLSAADGDPVVHGDLLSHGAWILEHETPLKKQVFLRVLAQFEVFWAGGVPLLVRALDDADDAVVMEACTTLRTLGPVALPAMPPLVQRFTTGTGVKQLAMLIAISGIQPDEPRVLAAMRQELAHADEAQRYRATLMLGSCPEVALALSADLERMAVSDPSLVVRANALSFAANAAKRCGGEIDRGRVRALAEGFIADANPLLRLSGYGALKDCLDQRPTDDAARSLIARGLADTHAVVALEAAQVAGRQRVLLPEAGAVIARLLVQSDGQVFTELLRTLEDQDLPAADGIRILQATLDQVAPAKQERMTRILLKLGDARDTPPAPPVVEPPVTAPQ